MYHAATPPTATVREGGFSFIWLDKQAVGDSLWDAGFLLQGIVFGAG